IGTERHEARRIDRQLRGRCARQGDPGSSHFFISLEDDLMRLFGSDRIVKYMEKMGLEEGQELEHPLLNRSIGQAQKRVEQHNFACAISFRTKSATPTKSKSASRIPMRSRKSSASRSWRRLTSCGRSIFTRWTACVTASACAAMGSAIR